MNFNYCISVMKIKNQITWLCNKLVIAKTSGDKWAGLLNTSDFDSPEIKLKPKQDSLKENKNRNVIREKKISEKSQFESMCIFINKILFTCLEEMKNLSKDSWMNDLNISDLSFENSLKIKDEIEKNDWKR